MMLVPTEHQFSLDLLSGRFVEIKYNRKQE